MINLFLFERENVYNVGNNIQILAAEIRFKAFQLCNLTTTCDFQFCY